MAEVECRGNVVIDHLSSRHSGLDVSRARPARSLDVQPTDGPHHGRRAGRPSLDAIRRKAQLRCQPAGGRQTGCRQSHTAQLSADRFSTGPGRQSHTEGNRISQRVHMIYGPVDSWEQELDANHPETLPPETLTLTSDDLNVNEDPLAARTSGEKKNAGGGIGKMGRFNCVPTGSVQIDGSSPTQGSVCRQRRQRRLRSTQGDVRSRRDRPATGHAPSSTLSQRTAQFITDTARKIQYNRRSRVQWQQNRFTCFEFTPGDARRRHRRKAADSRPAADPAIAAMDRRRPTRNRGRKTGPPPAAHSILRRQRRGRDLLDRSARADRLRQSAGGSLARLLARRAVVDDRRRSRSADPLESWPTVWKHFVSDGGLEMESVHRRKDGTEFPIWVIAAYYADEETEISFACCRDISEKKAAETRAAPGQRRARAARRPAHGRARRLRSSLPGSLSSCARYVPVHRLPKRADPPMQSHLAQGRPATRWKSCSAKVRPIFIIPIAATRRSRPGKNSCAPAKSAAKN